MMAATLPLNPFRDPGPWKTIKVGGFTLPGVILDVDGAEKPEEWSVQKGTAASNATTVWKGTKLAEAITITLASYDESTFDGLYELAAVLRPKIGNKPPSLVIESAVCNFGGITRIALKTPGQPKWNVKGYWTTKVVLIEYNPSKPAKAGPASPAKPGGQSGPPTQNEVLQQEINDSLKIAVAA